MKTHILSVQVWTITSSDKKWSKSSMESCLITLRQLFLNLLMYSMTTKVGTNTGRVNPSRLDWVLVSSSIPLVVLKELIWWHTLMQNIELELLEPNNKLMTCNLELVYYLWFSTLIWSKKSSSYVQLLWWKIVQVLTSCFYKVEDSKSYLC